MEGTRNATPRPSKEEPSCFTRSTGGWAGAGLADVETVLADGLVIAIQSSVFTISTGLGTAST